MQPEPGYVVKTHAKSVGKIFINMCKHEFVESFEERPIPKED